MRTSILCLSALMILASGCMIYEGPTPGDDFIGKPLTVTASLGGEPETKTILNPDKSIYWTPGDAINLFYGSAAAGQFTTNITEPAQTVEFHGVLSVATGSTNEGMAAQSFWAVYPYQEGNTCDGSSVTITIPSLQASASGSFADKLNPTVAKAPGLSLSFYNVASWLCFTVTQSGITSATLRGNEGEDVAGKIRVTMEGGEPVASVVEGQGQKSITITAPDGGFEVGELYYIVLVPGTFPSGVTLTLYKGAASADCVINKQLTFPRNTPLRKQNADAGLIFDTYATPELVDLGLPSGLKWASFNLGASAPEEYGDYFAWGEVEPYYSNQYPLTWKDGKTAGYAWESYKWCMGSEYTMTKYCSQSSYGNNGFTDTKTVLDPEDDVAHVNLGGNWRMPTDAEWTELREQCTWTWITQNGVNGRLVTSNTNGNSIFLPAAGLRYGTDFYYAGSNGYYWSSSLGTENPRGVWILYFDSSRVLRDGDYRFDGQSVRPVFSPVAESITLNKSSVSLIVGNTEQLSATVLPSEASGLIVSWVSLNTLVATVSENGVVTAVSEGIATIIASAGSKQTACSVTVTAQPSVPVPDAVDLGLSVKWASCNLGASVPEDIGDYYAWGETETRYSSLDPLIWKDSSYNNGYSWKNYQWCNGSENTLTKYNTYLSYGTVDDKTELETGPNGDDAASKLLGGNWRIPTASEWRELINNCTWIWTPNYKDLPINGYLVTSRINNKSIFLRTTGSFVMFSGPSNVNSSGDYWSSSLNTNHDPRFAWAITFYSQDHYMNNVAFRYVGCPIRPVYSVPTP